MIIVRLYYTGPYAQLGDGTCEYSSPTSEENKLTSSLDTNVNILILTALATLSLLSKVSLTDNDGTGVKETSQLLQPVYHSFVLFSASFLVSKSPGLSNHKQV